ncbi:MAG TPA: hypothetical protein VEI83_16150 [Acidimicrobiales bacterium]|nr:hypothetical protein [Acidimicrobiales bacterium]
MNRGARRRPGRSRFSRSEAGYTLVESALTCAVLGVLMAASVPAVSVAFRVDTDVQNTYNSLDQLALASEVVTRYFHEAVANAPGGSPFVAASANSATFYTNMGNSNGPEQITAQVTTSGSIRSFKLVLTPAVAGTCPSAAHPTYVCSYGASPDGLVLVNYLTNGTGGSPVFTYTLQGGATCAGPPPGSGGTTLAGALSSGSVYTSLSVHALTTPVSSGDTLVIGSGATTQTVTASGAAAVGATSIPVTSFTANAAYPINTSVLDQVCTASQVSQIAAVGMNLQATKSPGGQPTGYQSVAYLFSPAYNQSVG